jgi:hypothetical protein
VKDTLGLASEMLRALIVFWLFMFPMVILVGLNERDILQADTRIHLLVLIPSFFIIMDINLLSRHAWGCHDTPGAHSALLRAATAVAVVSLGRCLGCCTCWACAQAAAVQ